MDTYWVPGVNHLGTYGRWAFAEFTDVYQIEADFKAKVEAEFNKMIDVRHGAGDGVRLDSHGQESRAHEDRRDTQARRSQAEEHSDGGVPVRAGEDRRAEASIELRYHAQHATSIRNWSGAARTSRTGPISSSTRRRSISRRRFTRRC